uniref:Carboxypeptidase inhibitor n=1 Tax=Amblyomma maculatum TaxID=34609 RepID=G3MST1_AMBMU
MICGEDVKLISIAYCDANKCVSKGNGCIPKSKCPEEDTINLLGCKGDTVCCDLSASRSCESQGGECRESCKHSINETNGQCRHGKKCCVHLQ